MMIVLIGPSASGKTEIAKYLMKHFGYKKCITTTTRDKRIGEVADVDYHFVSKSTFEQYIKSDLLVEHSVYQQQYYGLLKRDMIPDGIVILDPNGANAALKLGIEVYVVYIEVSTQERYRRMLNRGDDKGIIASRIENDDALFDIKKIDRIDVIIENQGDLSQAARKIYELHQNRK